MTRPAFRAIGRKVLIQTEAPSFSVDDATGIAAYQSDNGFFLPVKSVLRDKADRGVIVRSGPAAFTGHVAHLRSFLSSSAAPVLFNKYAACVLDDQGLQVLRDTDILGYYPYAAAATRHYLAPLHDVVCIAPLPVENETSAGGILLPDVYRAWLDQGLDPSTWAVLQCGIGRVIGMGPQCSFDFHLSDWVVFSYKYAVYHHNPAKQRDEVLVREGKSTILAVLPDTLIRREYDEKAVLACR